MLSPNISYPNLRILNLASSDDIRRLLFILSDQYEHNDPQEVDDDSLLQQEVEHRLPSTLLHNLITNAGLLEASVITIVVEFDYVDRDTNISYVQLHARAFRSYPRRTVRLHFFRKEITSYSDFQDEDTLQSSYLGFCVLSP